jgi:hypothetical protein
MPPENPKFNLTKTYLRRNISLVESHAPRQIPCRLFYFNTLQLIADLDRLVLVEATLGRHLAFFLRFLRRAFDDAPDEFVPLPTVKSHSTKELQISERAAIASSQPVVKRQPP